MTTRCYKVVVSRKGEEVESPFCLVGERVGRVALTQVAFELGRLLQRSFGKPFGVFEEDDGSYLVTTDRYRRNVRRLLVRLLPVEGEVDPSRPVWKAVTQQRMVGEVGRFAYNCRHLFGCGEVGRSGGAKRNYATQVNR